MRQDKQDDNKDNQNPSGNPFDGAMDNEARQYLASLQRQMQNIQAQLLESSPEKLLLQGLLSPSFFHRLGEINSALTEMSEASASENVLPPIPTDNQLPLELINALGETELPLAPEDIPELYSADGDIPNLSALLEELDSTSTFLNDLSSISQTTAHNVQAILAANAYSEQFRLRYPAVLFRASHDEERTLSERLESLEIASKFDPALGAVGLYRLTKDRDEDVVEAALVELALSYPDIAPGILADTARNHENSFLQRRAYSLLLEADFQMAVSISDELRTATSEPAFATFVEESLEQELRARAETQSLPSDQTTSAKKSEVISTTAAASPSGGESDLLVNWSNLRSRLDAAMTSYRDGLEFVKELLREERTNNLGRALTLDLYFDADNTYASGEAFKLLQREDREFAELVGELHDTKRLLE